jgi:hypothetical protein
MLIAISKEFENFLESAGHRIIFEKGIECFRAEDRKWHFSSAPDQPGFTSASSISKKISLWPLMLSMKLEGGLEPGVLLRNTYQLPLSLTLPWESSSGDLPGIYKFRNDIQIDMENVLFAYNAVLYYCERLALVYRDNNLQHATPPFSTLLSVGGKVVFSGQEAPYFEFESLLTNAHRVFDYIRFPLWKAFGDKNKTPNWSSWYFPKVVKSCTHIPIEIKDEILEKWSPFWLEVKHYRDCIQHVIPAMHGKYILMEKVEETVWSSTCRIPDNPNAKFYKKFSFHKNLDALSYGWLIANQLWLFLQVVARVLPQEE